MRKVINAEETGAATADGLGGGGLEDQRQVWLELLVNSEAGSALIETTNALWAGIEKLVPAAEIELACSRATEDLLSLLPVAQSFLECESSSGEEATTPTPVSTTASSSVVVSPATASAQGSRSTRPQPLRLRSSWITGAALHFLVLTEAVVLCERSRLARARPESAGALAAGALTRSCERLARTHPKLRAVLSTYMFTRALLLPTWLAQALDFAVSTTQLIPRYAAHAAQSLYFFTSVVLLNPYSVDARLILAEQAELAKDLALLSLADQVNFVLPEVGGSEAAARPGLSQASMNFLLTVITIGPSTKWKALLSVPSLYNAMMTLLKELGPGSPSSCEEALAENAAAAWAIDGEPIHLRERNLFWVSVGLQSIFLLLASSEDLIVRTSVDLRFSKLVLAAVASIAFAKPVTLARLTLETLANRAIMGCVSTPLPPLLKNGAADAPQPDTPTRTSIGPTAALAGTCLILLHSFALTSVGAQFCQRNSKLMTEATKRLVFIHGEAALEDRGLSHLPETIYAAAADGTLCPRSASVIAYMNPRRLRHHATLMMCANCSRVSEGSRRLKVCGECHLARYCGRQCQQADWKNGHALICTARAGEAKKNGHPADSSATAT